MTMQYLSADAPKTIEPCPGRSDTPFGQLSCEPAIAACEIEALVCRAWRFAAPDAPGRKAMAAVDRRCGAARARR